MLHVAQQRQWTGKSRRWYRTKRPPRKLKYLKRETEELESNNDNEISETHIGLQLPINNRQQHSISECYFAGKGAALVLPQNECIHLYKKPTSNTNGGDIQQHLQSMFYLLRPEDTLKMAVKLESIHNGRMRYLVVVSCLGKQDSEESCLLGVDCNGRTTTIGLVLPVWADTRIRLDGDGGFSVSTSQRHHIFKPVSVQAMWSALQTLHKASAKARECHYFMGGLTHSWIGYYDKKVQSDRSCLNEWFAMDNLESRRPPSPDCFRSRPMEREITEQDIRVKLKEIMMAVDLDEVTSKYIRTRLEDDLDIDLHEYKSFIDQEMLTILGQMDEATEIFDHLYLGSEWNASNLEELKKNGVGHILNVTREIDNFFPGMFEYLNVRVYDDEGTELLKHWDTTYKFISAAKDKGSKVLVHCKMGVSRSASVVIAYAMKAHNWNMPTAFQFIKKRRTCVKPNVGFMKQLEIYQGILVASRHRHNTLWRSKSENNLNSQPLADESRWQDAAIHLATSVAVVASSSSSSTSLNARSTDEPTKLQSDSLCLDIVMNVPNHRPKSWSPDDNVADILFPTETKVDDEDDVVDETSTDVNGGGKHGKHVLVPCGDGKTYSVSPNKALHISTPVTVQPSVKFQVGDGSPTADVYFPDSKETRSFGDDDDDDGGGGGSTLPPAIIHRVSSIKDRINELESQVMTPVSSTTIQQRLDIPENKGLVLNLANQFECGTSSSPSPSPIDQCPNEEVIMTTPIVSQTKPPVFRHQAVLIRPSKTWTEIDSETTTGPPLKSNDLFSTQLDRVFDTEERRKSVGSNVGNRRHDSWGSSDSAICMTMHGHHRESPSRQTSCSSIDSRGTILSRECSWGSGDTKMTKTTTTTPTPPTIIEGLRNVFPTCASVRTLPSVEDVILKRTNSFDGALPSYIAREDATAGSKMAVIETVKGAIIQRSQSLRQNNALKLRNKLVLKGVPSFVHRYASAPLLYCPLHESIAIHSSSQPNIQVSGIVKQHKQTLENFIISLRRPSQPELEDLPGVVRRIQHEMESKTNCKNGSQIIIVDQQGKQVQTGSPDVASSASAHHVDDDDKSTVKSLVGKFEVNDRDRRRHRYFSETEVTNVGSSLMTAMTSGAKSTITVTPCKMIRQPVIAAVQNSTTTTTLCVQKKTKKAHGRTHPLSRLPSCCKPRNANSLYNTM